MDQDVPVDVSEVSRLPCAPPLHVFYLHGFASSAKSTKARVFAERLATFGLPLHCPDFNEPDFSTMTVTRMIGQVEDAIAALPPAPVVLIGSSLGGFVAWHTMARRESSPGDRLVLLAPAFDFGTIRMARLGEASVAAWREAGQIAVFHHAYGRSMMLGYELYEDAQQYDSAAVPVDVPTLVFQGQRDSSVDPAAVARFVAGRPNVVLDRLDDEHQLLDSLDVIWEKTARFIGLGDDGTSDAGP